MDEAFYENENTNITKIQSKNLLRIFNFYADQYNLRVNINKTFEEISKQDKIMGNSEFFKFCKDFEIPIERNILLEIYRKKCKRNGNKQIDYDTF